MYFNTSKYSRLTYSGYQEFLKNHSDYDTYKVICIYIYMYYQNRVFEMTHIRDTEYFNCYSTVLILFHTAFGNAWLDVFKLINLSKL